jgi:hypothetical protein
LRNAKNPYLLYEDSFYSRTYLKEIEKYQKNNKPSLGLDSNQEKVPIFEET